MSTCQCPVTGDIYFDSIEEHRIAEDAARAALRARAVHPFLPLTPWDRETMRARGQAGDNQMAVWAAFAESLARCAWDLERHPDFDHYAAAYQAIDGGKGTTELIVRFRTQGDGYKMPEKPAHQEAP